MFHNGDLENMKDWNSDNGAFGDFVFFSGEENCSFINSGSFTYELDDDLIENDISAWRLEYEHNVLENADAVKYLEFIAIRFDCDTEQALRYLTEEDNYLGEAELSWELQKHQAHLCKIFGYDCVRVHDENGVVSMIDMTKHLNNLVRI